jgi:Tetratricopeptide repeat/Protein of unknown function (DUF2914)
MVYSFATAMAEAALELGAVLEAAERAASDQNFASAEQLLRQAAVLQEATLGPRHPELANTLNNLGIVCERLGRTADAEACYRRAYAIARSTLAANDALLATSEQNLREFCLATGRPFEPPVVEPSTAPVRLPARDPIGDFDPPVPAAPSVTAAQRPDTASTTPVTRTSPAPVPVGASSVTPALRPVASTATTPVIRTSPTLPSPVGRPAASAQRTDTGTASVARTPRATSSRRNVTWFVVGSAIVLILVIALAVGLSRPGDSAERGPIPAVVSPADTPAPRTDAAPPAADSPPAGRTIARNSAPRPAATTAVLVDAKLCRTLSTTDWQCTPTTNPAAPGVFFFYTRVKAAHDTTVQHRWYQNGNLRHTVDLRVAANPGAGYRTYSRATVAAERAGNWTIELRDAEGALLHEERFVIP